MSESVGDFGQWHTAPDGMAHYVLGGKCLCGAKVKKFGGPPQRKPIAGTTTTGKFLTPLCLDCIDLNTVRWAEKGGSPVHVLSQRQFWWHQRTPGKR